MQYATNLKNRWEWFKNNELQILLDGLRQAQICGSGGSTRTELASEIIAEISKREMANH